MPHVLVDGDIISYRVGFGAEKESEKIAIARTAKFLETMLWEDIEAETYQGYLTGHSNFRNEVAITAPYKGNRTAPKPKHLGIIREYLISAWGFTVSDNQEADDDIAIEHTAQNNETIIASIDKDFFQLPGKHWNFVKKSMKEVTPEEALLNFYIQILTGDRVDNIQGIRGVGPVKAGKLLSGCKSEADMYAACCKAYGNKDRLRETATLCYLRRTAGEVWKPPGE